MEKIRVDFGAEPESSGFDVTPGKYVARVESIEKKMGDKGAYLLWKLKILTGACKGKSIDHRTTLVPGALFGLHDTLEAMGITVPKSAVSIDPDKFIGKTFGIETNYRTYEGNEYSQVKKVFKPETKSEVVDMDSSSTSLFSSEPKEADEVSIDLE